MPDTGGRAAMVVTRALGLLAAGFHVVKTAGLTANMVAFPTLRDDADPRPGPATSILVPARDEAHQLPESLPGMLAQPATEILVYDDGSRDHTAAVVRSCAARDARLRLLTGPPPPDGWTGKNWACHQLARAATGQLLMFCDADVRLAPGALAAVWAERAAQHADVFSVFPRQHTPTVGERLLVPLLDETVLAFLPHRMLTLPVRAAALATGQVLMFRRDTYHALGGHASVAAAIVEDLALARRARGHGHQLGLALGGDLIGARIYRGYTESVWGFGKSLRAVHADSRLLLAVSAAWHLVAYTLPWLCWWCGLTWRVAAVLGVVERLLANVKTGRRAYAEALLVPVTAPAALPVYALAARRTVRWKGRRYR